MTFQELFFDVSKVYQDVLMEDVAHGGACDKVLSMLDLHDETQAPLSIELVEDLGGVARGPVPWYRCYLETVYWLGHTALMRALLTDKEEKMPPETRELISYNATANLQRATIAFERYKRLRASESN